MVRNAVLAALLSALLWPAAARADWNGDAKGDVLAVASDGRLLLYAGQGTGDFVPGGGVQIGTGWSPFTAVLAPGDFSGDGPADLLARNTDGQLLLYRGTGTGGFVSGARPVVGTGWNALDGLMTPGDFSGDGKPDVLARASDGRLLLYRGNGAGGFVAGGGVTVGTGWGQFTALIGAGDFSGDGAPDVLARTEGGDLLLYRGDGAGGFRPGNQRVGTGWGAFTAIVGGGDFTGDGEPDLLARKSDGALLLYPGDGRAGFQAGYGRQVGSGWQSLTDLMLVPGSPPAPVPVPAPPAPVPVPPATSPPGSISTGKGCTPAGGRLRVKLKIRKRRGRSAPRVRRVVFFVKGGDRRVDRRAPYRVRLRATSPAGTPLRVYARIRYTRGGSRKLRSRTVSKRYKICA